MIATTAFHGTRNGPVSGWMGAVTMPAADPARRVYAVHLIDRRTGSVHRINGSPLVIFTRDPAEAATELLRNRDPRVWDTRADPIRTEGKA